MQEFDPLVASLSELLGIVDRDKSHPPAQVRAAALMLFDAIVIAVGGGTSMQGLHLHHEDLPVAIWRVYRILVKGIGAAAGSRPAVLKEAILITARNTPSAAAYRYCGLIHRELQLWGEALDWFVRAADAGSDRGWFDAAFTLIKRDGQSKDSQDRRFTPEALPYLERGADKGSGHCAFYLWRHWQHMAVSEDDPELADAARDRAEGYLVAAAQEAPGRIVSDFAWIAYAYWLREQGRWNEAFEVAAKAAALSDTTPALHQRYREAPWTAIKIALNAPQGAFADFGRIIDTAQSFGLVLCKRGEIEAQQFEKMMQALHDKANPAPMVLAHDARAAVDALPELLHGVPVRDVFSPDRFKGCSAQIGAFNQVKSLLRGGAQDTQHAMEALDLLDQCARSLLALDVNYAVEVLDDGGLQFLRGKLHLKLHQVDEAVLAFQRSAELKPDADHRSWCFEQLGNIRESTHEYAAAAGHFLDGLRISGHPVQLIRFANAKLLERPANNASAMLDLLKHFVDAQSRWTYTGSDPRLQSELSEFGHLDLPADGDPDSTAVRLARMVRIWQLCAAGEAPAVLEARQWVVSLLCKRIAARTDADGSFSQDVVYALAQLAVENAASSYLARLLRACAGIGPRGSAGMPPSAAHAANLGQVAEIIKAGCSAVGRFPIELVKAAVEIACRRPALFDENFRAAAAVSSLIWRGILHNYAQRGATPGRSAAQNFGAWLHGEVLSPLTRIEESTLRRRWLFEILVGDKGAVEYVLSQRLVNAARHILQPLLTCSSIASVAEWARTEGNDAVAQLGDRVILGADSWVPKAYDHLDTDNGDYAHKEVVVPHVQDRLKRQYEEAKIPFAVHHVATEGGPRLPDICAIDAACAAMDLTKETLSLRIFKAWGLPPPASMRVEIVAHGERDFPFGVDAELSFEPTAALPASRDLIALRNSLRKGSLETQTEFQWDTRSHRVWISRALPLRPAGSSALHREWLYYFNDMKREYEAYRRTGVPSRGYFDRMRNEFPMGIEVLADRPLEYCTQWTLVFHAVCDIFWGLFMTRIVTGQEDGRSTLLLLHGLKDEVGHLVAMTASSKPAQYIPHLNMLRTRLVNLEFAASRLLAQELRGWETSLFDLQEVVRAELVRSFDKEPPIAFNTLPGDTKVFGAVQPLSMVLSQLIRNTQHHGKIEAVVLDRVTDVDWSVSIATRRRTLELPMAARRMQRPGSTGQGLLYAKAMCEDAGLYFIPPVSDAELHRVTVGRGVRGTA